MECQIAAAEKNCTYVVARQCSSSNKQSSCKSHNCNYTFTPFYYIVHVCTYMYVSTTHCLILLAATKAKQHMLIHNILLKNFCRVFKLTKCSETIKADKNSKRNFSVQIQIWAISNFCRYQKNVYIHFGRTKKIETKAFKMVLFTKKILFQNQNYGIEIQIVIILSVTFSVFLLNNKHLKSIIKH